jgi:cytochrome b561
MSQSQLTRPNKTLELELNVLNAIKTLHKKIRSSRDPISPVHTAKNILIYSLINITMAAYLCEHFFLSSSTFSLSRARSI